MKDKTAREWDRMARHYYDFVENATSYSKMIILPALRHLLPDLEGACVLDAGCGHGHSTFFLEEFNPDEIIGVDLSAEMIRLAELEKSRRGSKAQFQLGDIDDLSHFTAGSFDVVVSINVTHFLPSLEPFSGQCSRLLKPGGVMIWGIIHPLYSALCPLARPEGSFPQKEDWQVRYHDKSLRSYVQPWIERAEATERFLSSSYHYTFSDYFKALTSAGLQITVLEEPVPLEEFRQAHPTRYEAYMCIPAFAILRAVKN